MRKSVLILLVIVFFIVCGIMLSHNDSQPVEQTPQQTQPANPQSAVLHSPTAKCNINGVLPDPTCTPGAINPNVTQANIDQTICVTGWTGTVRPSSYYTTKLKKQSIIDYGYKDTNLRDYEEDHLISLELGGNPTDVKNLWAEPDASPNPKDRIENALHAEVCSGKIPLAEAQRRIATNWQTALN